MPRVRERDSARLAMLMVRPTRMTHASAKAHAALGATLVVGWLAVVGAPWSPIARGDRAILGVLIALSLATLVAIGADGRRRALDLLSGGDSRSFALVVSALAAALTWKMVKGSVGDRGYSIDGAVYVMQARALSHGHFGAALRTPFQAFGARFLFEGPDHRLYGVFPPGWPLFLVPFAKLGVLRLQGPILAFALSMAQWWLAREVVRTAPSASSRHDELAVRLGLVVALLGFPRTVLTADAMSHAFVALLVTLAITLTIRMIREGQGLGARASALGALGVGVAIGWAFSARLLDGLMLGLALGVTLLIAASKGRVRKSALAIALVAALPFAGLVLAAQKAATGDALTPTQEAYFVRSDWPPSCHRLGFGDDVGCWVEHMEVRETMPNGYHLKEAVRVTRERASQFAIDTFGEALIALLVFAVVAMRPSLVHSALASFVLLFIVGYGLFYYGNAPRYGARHIFPVLPATLVLYARGLLSPIGAATRLSLARLALASAALPAIVVTQARRFDDDWPNSRATYARKSDLRRVLDAQHIDEGILRSPDGNAVLAAYDPVADGPERIIVADDFSGTAEVRRSRPELPTILALSDERVGRYGRQPPLSKDFVLELEREWPSFLRPSGVGAKTVTLADVHGVSGQRVLRLFAAAPGGVLAMPFEVAVPGKYAFRVDGLSGPDHGDWDLAIDGVDLPTYHGYAPTPGLVKGARGPAIFMDRARHVLVAKLAGKAAESTGIVAELDVLVGVPAP